ncbi:homoserine O-acetyltransferase MetX [Indiicoccus explosivorum]|uniref:homoserine O-acetyltransferase MetX n=1 Tax=Indiicoccus explosivorum TaxID=1917864 RepID=UPI000B447019|nr:homoserine O-acetyltransferase [Indiicoccus explosivorum]
METVEIGPHELESGDVLPETVLAYEDTGNPEGPVVLICHALTGDQYAAGGWWKGLIGPGKAVDTDRFRVLSFNAIGGCHGSTGPLSVNPATGEQYRSAFPAVTVRDMVRAERKGLDLLGVGKMRAVIGGSLGGMRALEWGSQYPGMLDFVIPVAASPALSPYGIAFNTIGIRAIENDPLFLNGHYESSADLKGLEIARMAAMVTYRSDKLFAERFGRDHNGEMFEVESYLDHQGAKLARRFDANSYITLLRAMNSHDVSEEKIETGIFALSFTNDLLYPSTGMSDWLKKQPAAEHELVETVYGHDGFLVEFEKWGYLIKDRLEQDD